MADAPNSGEPKPKKRMPKGKPFQKGDPRINRAGRPKAVEGWREGMRDDSEDARRLHRANVKAALALDAKDISEAANAVRKIGANSASFVIEQGWGKASQAVELTGKDGAPLVDPVAVVGEVFAALKRLDAPPPAPAAPAPAQEPTK